MRQQKSLFDAPDSSVSQSTQLSTALIISGQRLAPEQKLFNQLLAKIEKSKRALENFILWVAEHRVQYAARMAPLEQQQEVLQKQMILFLDQRLQNSKGLSKAIRAYIVQVLCSLAGSLVNGPDGAEMTTIYQRHSTGNALDGKADATAAMQEMMADVFGVEMDADEQLDSPEQVMAAAMRKMQEQREQQATAYAAKKDKQKKTPKQVQAERESIDSDKVLRDIYRKLASALHPDRETDEKERQRKTALMVEVNIANQQKDMLALLQLQIKVEQIDTNIVSAMAEEKLRHFNRLLKEQSQSLQKELDQVQFMFRSEFDLPSRPITRQSLEISLINAVLNIEQMIGQMTADLAKVQDDRGLKAWVKEQKALSDDDFDEFDIADLAAFSAALAKSGRAR